MKNVLRMFESLHEVVEIFWESLGHIRQASKTRKCWSILEESNKDFFSFSPSITSRRSSPDCWPVFWDFTGAAADGLDLKPVPMPRPRGRVTPKPFLNQKLIDWLKNSRASGHEQLISNDGRFKQAFFKEIRSRQWLISVASRQTGLKTSYAPP